MSEALDGFLALAWSERQALADSAAAHLDLVVEAIALAVAVGVPLGIVATRSRPLERLVLGAANVLQTIPSLALLGFLLILFNGRIGKPPALAALVVYALLPIVKNTVLGLRGIDRGVAEAAVGMGMTRGQRLAWVELPLAVPIILGGVRVATVAAVGMATIATLIGARGLGGFIFSGVQLVDYRRILLGALPAAGLALACDAALGEIERTLDPRSGRRAGWRGGLAIVAIVGLLALAARGFWLDVAPASGGRATVTVGSKDSAEAVLLGHMLADLVEAHTPLRADRRLGLGGTLVCYEALRGGGLDAYVEYTGTALTAIARQPPQADPAAVRAAVRRLVEGQGVTMLDPLGFENTFAVVMRRDVAARLGIRRLSDLSAQRDTIRLGFGPEFGQRPDGFPGLARAYGLSLARTPREMDRNLLYEAVARGSIDVGVGDSTDGRIATLDLVILEDDRRFFPPYEAVPLVRSEALRRHPGLRGALDRLAGRIDTATMQRLNHEVDGLHRPPAEVAREFLGSIGALGR